MRKAAARMGDSRPGPEEILFFQKKPESLPLYERFAALMRETFPDAAVKVGRTQISYSDGCGFAFVSLPRRKSETGFLLSLGLPSRLDSPRVALAVEPYPGRWTVHIPLDGPAALDGELLAWLAQAHDFALSRRRK